MPWNQIIDEESDCHRTPEHLFYQYVEATPLGILLIDSQGSITYANASALACFGYESDELLGQPIEILVPTPLRKSHIERRNHFLLRPEQRMMGGRHLAGRRKDGSAVWVAIGLNPLVFNNTCRVACTVMDLTDTLRAEQDLTRFFELSLDLFCIANVNGYFLRVNRNFSRVLGYSEEVLLSRPFLEFVHPHDIPATRQIVTEIARGQPVVRFRNRYRCASGAYRWFEWSSQAVLEEGIIFASARDMTEQVQLESELVVRERRERAILDNTPAVVHVKGRDGKYEYINQQFADVFSVSSMQVIGLRDREIFSPEVTEQFCQNDQQVLDSGQRVTFQETVFQDDGVHTYVSTKFPLFDAVGDITAVAGISTDITEQIRARETENQLRMARAFQMKLYPARAPIVPGLDTAGSAVPVAQVCGDYYDFIPCGPGRLLVAMGDVSGHGIGPALEMVAVRTAMRLLLRDPENMLYAIEELNRKLYHDLPESTFVSLLLAELDGARRQIRYIGAGHEAILARRTGEVCRLESTGPLLGIVESPQFEERVISSLEIGDLFLLYTDGLTEAMSYQGEPFSTRRLIEVATRDRHQSAESVIGTIFEAVYEFASGKTIADDMTMVAVKMIP